MMFPNVKPLVKGRGFESCTEEHLFTYRYSINLHISYLEMITIRTKTYVFYPAYKWVVLYKKAG